MVEGRRESGADLLAQVRREIDERRAQLRPAVDEYEQLLGASDALLAPAAGPTPTAPVGRRAAGGPSAPAGPDTPDAGAPVPIAAAGSGALSDTLTLAKRRAPAKPRQPRIGAGEQAILAALEHGSHTVSELVVVTAMSGPEIRKSARVLLSAGRIVRASREGRAVYALPGKE
jgi:hypothetical protein